MIQNNHVVRQSLRVIMGHACGYTAWHNAHSIRGSCWHMIHTWNVPIIKLENYNISLSWKKSFWKLITK